ncbi:MAG TPA: hypothetical protein PKA00_01750 [Saprospiraceae bacterium]|nr:hypothetical protein [Saprospiraceae bacterium]HMQ81594.1 hypothetical protein [Saprospiraceae bacterium]
MLQKDIVQQSVLNLRLLQTFEDTLRTNPEVSLADFWKKVNDSAAPYESGAATLMVYLYGLVVYPWEIMQNQRKKKYALYEIKADEWGDFQILNMPQEFIRKQPRLGFVLELMRNATSHASVTIDADKRVVFKDRKGTRIRFSKEGLLFFLEKFHAYYLN